jgi:hypothetical protein
MSSAHPADPLADVPDAGLHPPVVTAPASRVAAFLGALAQALGSGSFAKLVLAKPVARTDDELQRIDVRLIALRGLPALSFVYTHARKDVTRNEDPAQGQVLIGKLLGPVFAHAHLTTAHETVELRISRKGQQTLRRRAVGATGSTGQADGEAASAVALGANAEARVGSNTYGGLGNLMDRNVDGAADITANTSADASTHDRQKQRAIEITRPFLVELGVTDAAHRLIPSMARKWKQINKFVEVFDHALVASGLLVHAEAPLRVADFGSGKAYLTFAVHEHLARTRGLAAQTTGIELRPDLVAFCNAAARRAGLQGLAFVEGDVDSHQPDTLDVMIALHACDTATDHAIHLGLRAGARVIMCSPCCHKELRLQLSGPAALAPMLRHGVHLGQQAEMVTDTLRALLLEAEGYDTRVFEFVALEHTSKNKMILAVKRPATGDAMSHADAARAQVGRIKSFYAIREQRLERLLLGLTTD